MSDCCCLQFRSRREASSHRVSVCLFCCCCCSPDAARNSVGRPIGPTLFCGSYRSDDADGCILVGAKQSRAIFRTHLPTAFCFLCRGNPSNPLLAGKREDVRVLEFALKLLNSRESPSPHAPLPCGEVTSGMQADTIIYVWGF